MESGRFVESGEEYAAPQPQRWGKVALAVGAACALLVVGFATGSHWYPQALTSNVAAPLQLNAIAVVPPREQCAKVGVNCIAQKCCKTTGYECYEVTPGNAKCMKECTPGKDGTCFHHAAPMVQADRSTITRTANTFFCFSFYADNTGSTKKKITSWTC